MITALDKGTALPDSEITAVIRSDGSGATFIFTNYLSKISPEWKDKIKDPSGKPVWEVL